VVALIRTRHSHKSEPHTHKKMLRAAAASAWAAMPPRLAGLHARTFVSKTKGARVHAARKSSRSTGGVKKRFHARANGELLSKPAARSHGMAKKGRLRNQDKGAAVVVSPQRRNGNLWLAVRRMGFGAARPRPAPAGGEAASAVGVKQRSSVWKLAHPRPAAPAAEPRFAPMAGSLAMTTSAWSHVVGTFAPKTVRVSSPYFLSTAGKQSFR